jgi:hypothetical protein
MSAGMLFHRQEILRSIPGPQVWALIDAAVLRRAPGGHAGVLSAQITRLITAVRSQRVRVQIIPADCPDTLAAPGPFSIVRLPGQGLPDAVILEQLTTFALLDDAFDAARYWEIFTRLALAAPAPDATLELLQNADIAMREP